MDRDVYRRLDALEGRHWWFAARRRILKSAIQRFRPKAEPLRVLEAGCGTGGNLEFLSEFGSVDAFELDDEARALAEAKAPVGIRKGMLPDDVPFANGRYDIVAAFDVIEHVDQDVASLRSLGERLAPGGRLLMTVPALPWLWSSHDDHHHHFRRYVRSDLLAALEAAGLKPVEVTYYNTLLFPLVAGVRFLKKLLRLEDAPDDRMPAPAVNAVLRTVFASERALIGRVRLPIGVSLLAVAERA
jgi:SAM-dependent methyltransferase